MSNPLRLNAECNALDTQLLLLEWGIEERQRGGVAVLKLADRMVSLIFHLKLVNAKLARLRGPAAST